MVVRIRWAIYAALALLPVVGALVGALAVQGKPPVYSAESRLAVVAKDLGTGTSLAETYARYLTDDMVRPQLNPAVSTQVQSITASPIPDSNVLRIEVKASDPAAALAATKTATTVMKSRVVELSGQGKAKDTLAKLERLNRQVATQQSRVNASGGTGSDYIDASTQLGTLQAQANALNATYQSLMTGAAAADLSVVREPVNTGDNAASRKQIYLLAGFGGGALIAYVIGRLVAGLRLPEARDRRRPDRAPQPESYDPFETYDDRRADAVQAPVPAHAPAAPAVLPEPLLQVEIPDDDRPRRVELPRDRATDRSGETAPQPLLRLFSPPEPAAAHAVPSGGGQAGSRAGMSSMLRDDAPPAVRVQGPAPVAQPLQAVQPVQPAQPVMPARPARSPLPPADADEMPTRTLGAMPGPMPSTLPPAQGLPPGPTAQGPRRAAAAPLRPRTTSDKPLRRGLLDFDDLEIRRPDPRHGS
ncbi:hypothetical protein ACIB24_21115 [Spongisporangium articulatum]|uniref:Chain length determinant protein n=1 Tax=Spongisporangium articulatum TaxID=3362603 RepID=A0ABW8AT47_9ACTN